MGKVRKSKLEEHWVCSECGACYFCDKKSAEACFDGHEEDYKGYCVGKL